MSDRMAGVLLHPTSLPGPFGAGDFGPAAEAFLDWAQSAGLNLWQILPLSPSAIAHSPYSTLSAFAVDPYLISLERLVQDGLLDADDLPPPVENLGHCRFTDRQHVKEPLLLKAWQRFREAPPGDLGGAFETFCSHPLQSTWLDDWCLFKALRTRFHNAPWWTWETGLRTRQPHALHAVRSELADVFGYERFLQFCAARHWRRVRDAARDRGLQILGDVPIYVAHDSAEVWARPHLFELDEDGRPLAVAGVPPDYFAEDGQLWGNPLYRWSAMAEDNFRWWVHRLQANLAQADWVRLDHFRGFADYWRIAGDATTARDGTWHDGPGKALFDAFAEQLGNPLPLMAEDLGDLSDAVHTLRRAVGLPGMKVVQFGFDNDDSDHIPFRLDPHTLYYTGTHDNDTCTGWFQSLDDHTRRRLCTYLGRDVDSPHPVHRQLIRTVMNSVARWAVVPMQDILGLDGSGRMNTPGVAEGNWTWRLRALPRGKDAAWLRRVIDVAGRLDESS